MALYKIGENLSFVPEENILEAKEALYDDEIATRFIKLAKKLKRVAPRAKDFLYGSCIMMHAAEASLIDQKTGEPILGDDGKPVTATFEKIKTKNGKESVRWKCSKKDLKPYKNANGDIFPEEELLKAYKKWISKPLCKDHKSDSVDGIRGIIIDTYYDPKFKRVHALFALDRKNYGDLARKVETGYANAVSMGTAVGRSVCTECGNVATTEREFCNCVRARQNYGEINLDLNPIELSLVVNGADGLAKVRHIVASMNAYAEQKQARIDELVNDRCINPVELQSLADTVNDMQKKLNSLMQLEKVAAFDENKAKALVGLLNKLEDLKTEPNPNKDIISVIENMIGEMTPEEKEEALSESKKVWPQATGGGSEPSFSSMRPEDTPHPAPGSFDPSARFAGEINEGGKQGALSSEISLLRSKIENLNDSLNELKTKVSKEENNMNSARLRARAKARRAYWLGGGGINEPTPGKPKYEKEDYQTIRDEEDRQMTGEPLETGSEGLHPGDEETLKSVMRDGLNLSKAELEERRMRRRAYWQGGGGVAEPTPGKPKYEKEDYQTTRDEEDSQMTGTYDMGGTDGIVPSDLDTKQKLSRARLRAKFTKVADKETGKVNKAASRWDIYAGDKLILSANGEEIYGEELDDNWDYLNSKQYGRDVMSHIRNEGFSKTAYLLKGAQPPMDPMAGMAPAPAEMPEVPAQEPAPSAPAEKEEAGDLKEKVDMALGDMEKAIEAIREAVSEGDEGVVNVDVDIVRKKEDEEPAVESTPVEKLTASKKEALELYSLMDEAADELALISEAFEKDLDDASYGKLTKAASQALSDSESILSEASKIVDAKKKDKEEDKKEDKEEDKKEKKDKKDKKEDKEEEGKEEKKDKKDKKEDKEEEGKEEEEDEERKKKDKKVSKLLEDALKLRAQNRAALLKNAIQVVKDMTPAEMKKELEQKADDMGDDALDLAYLMDETEDEACDKYTDDGDWVEEEDDSMVTARKKARELLVAEAAEKILNNYELDLGSATNATEPTYFKAHPGGKGTETELTHTKTPEAKVETLSEVHDVMRDVAESGPRNVREAAMILQEKVASGEVKAEDIDKLVSEGKVDETAAQYWKKYWGMASDGDEFGKELVEDFTEKKKEAEDKTYKIKLRRAYNLGLQAQSKGFIESSRSALDTYVDEVMQLDDAAFESTKRIIAKMNPANKKSGKLPRVGAEQVNAEDLSVTASSEPTPEPNLVSQLSNLGWK